MMNYITVKAYFESILAKNPTDKCEMSYNNEQVQILTRFKLSIKDYLPLSMMDKIVAVGGDAAVAEVVRNELRTLFE